ncbi:MAG: PQQ-dependent dehydrogenase, methanol/ethanol family [Alphaproteobacteria bacterium]|nr:PQQ-dependent dehydrogenase, methanol/ethanol family [Alphaproteobacteria bacterium]
MGVPLVGALIASTNAPAAPPSPAVTAAQVPAPTPEAPAAQTPAPAPAPTEAETRQAQRAADQKRMRAAAKIDAERIKAANTPEQVGNWLAHGRTYDEQRFSPLDLINKANVGSLGVAWEFETGTVRGLEASPIIADGVMFVTGSWSIVWALDAKTGRELWTYDPEVPGSWARNACCDVVNRGVAVWDGRVYVGTLDGRLVALDADTGKPIWDVNTIDRSRPYVITGAPRIVNGLVIIGNGGAELGVRGYVTAYDAKTGRQVWRFYTVPGKPGMPVENPELTEAMKTWTEEEGQPRWWEVGGGGTVWDSMAYDPDLDLLYIGVGNGSPWNRYMRSPGGGDNLYLSSIVALKPATGKMVWYYQETPGDSWDFTATQHMILADLPIEGRVRKVIMQAPKNGFFYVLDRETGELLSADAYVGVTWAKGIDLKTGRPIENTDVDFKDKLTIVAPAQVGGHNWQPMTFSPQTGLVYIPTIDASAIFQQEQTPAYRPGIWNTGTDFITVAKVVQQAMDSGQPLPPAKGFIRAWDPIARKERWSVPMGGAWNSGLLSTGGGLVFGGGMDGIFAAYDAQSGEQLWKMDLTTGILAPAVTYTVDGEQYVVVSAGWGGAWGLANLRDPAAAAIKYGTNAGRIFAFKLGGSQKVEPLPALTTAMAKPPASSASAQEIEKGFELYHRTCLVCHGFLVESAGVVPDLRKSAPEVWNEYREIVLNGTRADRGMASFADQLTPEEVDLIRAYTLSRAQVLFDTQAAQAPN